MSLDKEQSLKIVPPTSPVADVDEGKIHLEALLVFQDSSVH